MSATLLSLQQLSVAIGGKQICRDFSLDIMPGQRWGLLGINGAGKTTLLHTLAGLRSPQSGRILLEGQAITSLPRRSVARQMGLLLQDENDPFPGTVLEIALMGRHPYLGRWQWEDSDDLALARAALTEVELDGLEQRQIGTLSGGERRRLSLATLLTQDPQIFLLDEPTNHLDPHHQIHLLSLLTERVIIGQSTAQAKCLLMILHDINIAARFCDHVILLFGDGEVCAGPLQAVLNVEVLSQLYGHPMTRLDGPNGPVYLPK